MRKQNSLRRTVIAFLLVFFLSALSWSIQNYTEERGTTTNPLEANAGSNQFNFTNKLQ